MIIDWYKLYNRRYKFTVSKRTRFRREDAELEGRKRGTLMAACLHVARYHGLRGLGFREVSVHLAYLQTQPWESNPSKTPPFWHFTIILTRAPVYGTRCAVTLIHEVFPMLKRLNLINQSKPSYSLTEPFGRF